MEAKHTAGIAGNARFLVLSLFMLLAPWPLHSPVSAETPAHRATVAPPLSLVALPAIQDAATDPPDADSFVPDLPDSEEPAGNEGTKPDEHSGLPDSPPQPEVSTQRPVQAPDRSLTLYQNAKVQRVIAFLLERKRDVVERGLKRSGRYLPMIHRIFREEGLPDALAYLAAVESNFNPAARSSARAVGMWQIMAPTARKFGLQLHRPWYDERLDPEMASRAAARLLAYLYDRYNSWELALAAYNAGEGRVNQALKRARRSGRSQDYWNLHLPRQTRGFVPAFLALAEIFTHPERYGLEDIERDAPLEGDLVELHVATTLDDVARRLDTPLPDLMNLNPAWRRRIVTRPDQGKVHLRVPQASAPRLLASFKTDPVKPIPWLEHRVREGETVSHIARLYGVPTREILSLNGLRSRSLLAIGQRLLVPLAKGDAMKRRRAVRETTEAVAASSVQPAITQLHIHTVQAGESLWSIARHYGVRMTDLKRWNGLKHTLLHPHQELSVFLPENAIASEAGTF